MSKKGRGGPQRSYSRLDRHERNAIERMLDRGMGCRAIARELGRSPSTVADEVARHRFVTSPRARYGEPAPEGLGRSCPRLGSWPRCCNGCARRRGYGCSRRPKAFYKASMAQRAADAELSESRRGIDEDEASAAAKIALVRAATARGMSPQQVCDAYADELGKSRSTIYRWHDAGYGGMSNMDLRRKVAYKKRRHAAEGGPTRHSASRSHAAFMRLPADARDAAWEMDCVCGRAADRACLLTLLHRPTRLQLALPMPAQDSASVAAALGLVSRALGGPEGMRRVFGAVLTDNGSEFSDESGVAELLGERAGEARLFYCDPSRPDQKGACERNHVELRKLLPKGRGLSFERLTRADCALVMSQVNSEPRGALAGLRPSEVLLAALGDDARALMDAFGIELLGRDELDLTPGCVERARALRGEPPLA